MPKQNQENAENSSDTGGSASADLSVRLLAALTQQEIAQLIDALFGVLSLELQKQAIAQLPPDTQQTVKQILAPPHTVESTQATAAQTVSRVKHRANASKFRVQLRWDTRLTWYCHAKSFVWTRLSEVLPTLDKPALIE